MKMNRIELIQAIAQELGIHRRDAMDRLDTIVASMQDTLAKGDRIELRGLGSFKVKDYKAYTGRNPKTGENIAVLPKKLPVFIPSKHLRTTLK